MVERVGETGIGSAESRGENFIVSLDNAKDLLPPVRNRVGQQPMLQIQKVEVDPLPPDMVD